MVCPECIGIGWMVCTCADERQGIPDPKCSLCVGLGFEPDSVCPRCDGTGHVDEKDVERVVMDGEWGD